MIYEALFSLLTANSDVAALVGTRVYPVKMPDDPQLPAISLQVADGDRGDSLEGSDGLASELVQIDCWSRDMDQVKDLAKKARAALRGYRGTVAGLTIGGILGWRETDLFDEDAEIFHVSCLCRVWHSDA